jgi:hypothetical protein
LAHYCSACSYALQLKLPIPAGECLTAKGEEVTSVPLAKILPPVLILSAVAVIVGLIIWRRLRGRNRILRERLNSTSERLLTTEHEMLETQGQLVALRKVWEISWSDLALEDCIGHGAMGQVWRGTWRGLPVAVKVLTGLYSSVEELREEMDHEATMLQTLRHAHVVQFHGAGMNPESLPFLVTELMELGALSGLLTDPSGGLVCM